MNLTSRHISFAKLADLAEGRMRADEQLAARTHVSACPHCSARISELEQVIGLMRTDTSEAAPRDVVADALNVFRPRAASVEPSRLRRLLAALSFDSTQLAPAYGVRSGGQQAARQLLYTTSESDLDLRVAPSGDEWVVSGQLLGECAGGHVELASAEGATAEADLNEQCEFTLPPVPVGTYTLRVRLADAEVEVPELELRA